MTNNHKQRKYNGGAAMMVSLIFSLFISLAIIAGLVSSSIRVFKNSNVDFKAKQAYFFAESGVEDALYRIKNNMTISSTEIITLGSNTATTNITTVGGQKNITSLGDVNNYQRKINMTLATGLGVIFKYGTQAGQGGFVFRNNSYILGSIYSNGNIVGANNAYITGDAFVAGSTGSISNMRVGYGGTGNAHANSVTNSTVTGALYCKTGSGNNKSCNTSQPNPNPEPLPLSDEVIAQWKVDATAGGTTTGNVTISSPTTLGPRKIVGNLTINSTLTLQDTVYVTGNITISGTVRLDPSYGASSGIIMSDGYITINGGVNFQDSGTIGSYILLLSESNCDESMTSSPCNSRNAIDVSNNSDISIVNAQKGTVYFSNNASVKEAVGNKIILKNNVGITYGSGLFNVNFTSGPGGGWVLQSWMEGI